MMAVHGFEGILPSLPMNGDRQRFWIAPGAHVIGDVALGMDASVWFGAVLRGDNERIDIGPGCNIQDGCVLHADLGFPLLLEEEITVGHRAVLHGCRIGRRTLVGIGAIVLNGANIGRECLIGAGALVGEGVVIGDRSLVLGVPGRVVREIDDEEATGFATSAQEYRDKAHRYRDGLQPL